ncbi:hypothetical protein SARC_05432 [Sphaeroforma arctica JP610]|uniref:DUF202 domain-containing protein n=1 Tax=Sphaeroforma arctica JP610 TaxID=667725 RepID=A0A0L0FZL0_9EUKA|nr:hypothetical protein SARC_05432 [Sphaeroforma arctica JP610]KNC82277.1 hypothetical protein SARC_05432 [Sphaeroforma arctica JP610]|eukprot:XP_014156179.1 hypothetical protein SARC_05432 [Sphaeroforma arctica JP610]
MSGKAEPKVYFANERTFLNWLHTAVLISSTGLALMNLSPNSGASSRTSIIAGAIMIPVAILFMAMSLWTFVKRDRMIKNGGEEFQSKMGPILITVLLLGALVLQYGLWFAENGSDVSNWYNKEAQVSAQ